MKNLLSKAYVFIASKLSGKLPSWFCFWFEYMKIEISSVFIYKKLKNFSPSMELLDKKKINIICFSEHPYTNKILRNGINQRSDKFNLITFGKVFDIYTNITQGDRISSFNMEKGGNYCCYEELGKYYKKNNSGFFNEQLLGACDFSLPTQIFNMFKKNIIYLNHRFPYLGFFNVFKFSDWEKKINNLKQKNNILITASNFDYEYYKYFLGKSRIYHIPPLLDDIPDKYEGISKSFLIVPGKNKIFNQRENIINLCIKSLQNVGVDNVYSITTRYKDKKYEFKEIALYKALIVIPYTIYIGSIMDFLEMGMPMFFPSVKLLSKWHKEYNLLVEYDFMNEYNQYCGKNIFSKKFFNKIENYVGGLSNIPSPYSDDISDLEYWIGKSDRYTNWPIITYDDFDDLGSKLKTTNMEEYSKILLKFIEKEKIRSKDAWGRLLDYI